MISSPVKAITLITASAAASVPQFALFFKFEIDFSLPQQFTTDRIEAEFLLCFIIFNLIIAF